MSDVDQKEEERIKRGGSPESQIKAFELLLRASEAKEVTVRDDEYDYSWLLDSAKLCKKRGCCFRLIDSGKLELSQMEWLAGAGAEIFTSDEARPRALELELLSQMCRSAGSFVACFQHGTLEEDEEKSGSISIQELMNLGISGVYLHISNKDKKRDFSLLNSLAHSCRKGGSWLVYYHHGLLEASLEELACHGAWIHLSDQSLIEAEEISLLLDTIKSARRAGTNLVFHLEKGADASLLREMIKAGVYLQFDLSHLAVSPELQTFFRRWEKRRMDSKAYYLWSHFLP
ncbi:MAG: hypothetical protein ACE5L7_03820 [Candidatus Aminicenantales bacterium]